MFRTKHHHHLPDKRRPVSASTGARRAVRPGHVLAWEFGEMLEYHAGRPADAADPATHAIFASLDKALALSG